MVRQVVFCLASLFLLYNSYTVLHASPQSTKPKGAVVPSRLCRLCSEWMSPLSSSERSRRWWVLWWFDMV